MSLERVCKSEVPTVLKRDYDGPGKLFENGSGFYYYTGKMFDMLAVSFLWLLGSLPVITVGASFSALYAAASRSIRQEEGSVGERFWKSYKRDLKSAILPWVLFAGAICLLLLNIGILWNLSDGLFRLFFVLFYGFCILLLIAALGYVFPAVSRFDMPAGWILKLSFYLTVRHLPVSLFLIVLTLAGYFLVLAVPVLVLVIPGVWAWLISMLVDPVLDQHLPQ